MKLLNSYIGNFILLNIIWFLFYLKYYLRFFENTAITKYSDQKNASYGHKTSQTKTGWMRARPKADETKEEGEQLEQVRLYRAIILPIAQYVCETWGLIALVENKLLTFEMTALRIILAMRKLNKIRDDEIH